MEKKQDLLKTVILVALVVGMLCLIFGGGTGAWVLQNSVEIAESLPPPPEGPPDAGAYGMLFGLALIFLGGGTGLVILILAGALAVARAIRRRRKSADGPQ